MNKRRAAYVDPGPVDLSSFADEPTADPIEPVGPAEYSRFAHGIVERRTPLANGTWRIEHARRDNWDRHDWNVDAEKYQSATWTVYSKAG